MRRLASVLLWGGISALGAAGFGVLAFSRGETVNAAWLLVAAVCTYAVAYRFYSRFLAARVFGLDERRATPAERFNNGRDFVPTNKWVLYGHHFAAIAGAGPLVGPVLAAQFGFLPGTIWLVIGVVLGGAVQDFTILFCSLRRDGKSLGQMAKEEVNPAAGAMAMLAVLFIMIILLAVLALIVVNALKASPWGLFTIACTIPIALLMGWWMKVWRPGRVGEASVAGARVARRGSGLRRHAVPDRVHRDRLRRDLRVPCARRLGHDTQDGRPRAGRAHDRLRWHADGVVRRRDGDDRGVHPRPRGLLRDEHDARRAGA